MDKRPYLKKAAAVLFWLAVWEILSVAIGEEILIASPLAALRCLLSLARTGAFWKSIALSGWRIVQGLLIAIPAAFVLSYLSSRFSVVLTLFMPLVSFLKSVPVASFIILALVYVSSSHLSTLIAFTISFPVLYLSMLEGFRSYDPSLDEMARVYRIDALRRFLYIRLSACIPYIASGISSAVGLAWKSGIAAEVIGIPSGTIGESLYRAKIYLMTGDLFAWTAVIVLLSALTDRLVRALLRPLERRYR